MVSQSAHSFLTIQINYAVTHTHQFQPSLREGTGHGDLLTFTKIAGFIHGNIPTYKKDSTSKTRQKGNKDKIMTPLTKLHVIHRMTLASN
jgi:hypothetical protein